MLFFVLTIAIQVALIIHVIKTGRNTIWIWVLALLSLAGAIAYIAAEILPELIGGRTARRVVSNAKKAFDPSRDLRAAHQRLRQNDSIDARRRVAEELCNAGKYEEA